MDYNKIAEKLDEIITADVAKAYMASPNQYGYLGKICEVVNAAPNDWEYIQQLAQERIFKVLGGANARKVTQIDRLLQYLREYGYITPLRALNELGIMRLSARIKELRQLGHHITTEFIEVRTRDGKTRVAQYTLKG